MKTDYESQLETILNGLQIDPVQNTITLLADGSQTEYQPDTLQTTLSTLIYRYFYCASDTAAPITASQPDDSFLEQLSLHNRGVETFDAGWTIDAIDMAGIPYASKGNDRRMIYAGEFVYDTPKRGSALAGDAVRLLMHHEHRDAQSGFYYVFGQTPGDDSVTLQTRLYFHTTPSGSLELVSWVTHTLNTYRIPFQFKCLNHPELYHRSDSAVLYLQKPHVNIVLDLLVDALPDLSPYLHESVPLFSRRIAPGIGFAESPPNPQESFGTSRCSLIAQGIADAIKNQQPANAFKGAVEAVFAQLGLPLENPYRNPQSSYSYTFPDPSIH